MIIAVIAVTVVMMHAGACRHRAHFHARSPTRPSRAHTRPQFVTVAFSYSQQVSNGVRLRYRVQLKIVRVQLKIVIS